MRGILYKFFLFHCKHRFNPAYAGNIAKHSRRTKERQVQPRVCGEYWWNQERYSKYVGSTPRMRGIFSVSYVTCKRSRFNPAYAGNMHAELFSRFKQQVQPRVCGEYLMNKDGDYYITGSTPRMRGISILFSRSPVSRRFNPAYAGNIMRCSQVF